MNNKTVKIDNAISVRDDTGTGNQLYPVFLKLHELNVLLVGAGNVGIEKLNSLLSNSPQAKITVVAPLIRAEVRTLLQNYPACKLVERSFAETDLTDKDLVILATDNKILHKSIKAIARKKRILVNVADTPDLCDFYLGSIVKKGNLKVAISSNGKSPTITKRVKEIIDRLIPDEIDELLDNMEKMRQGIDGSFEEKVVRLNELTKSLVK